MARFTDADIPCVCTHFVADHAWNDPLARASDELAGAYSIRFAQADEAMMQQRNEAQVIRTKCHQTGCPCTDYQERKVA